MKAKRILSSVLALVLMLSTLFSVNVFAATSSEVYTSLKSKLPLVTYAMPLSGANKVYAYKDSSLKTKESGYYISTFSDQIVITEISSNGKAVEVTYPSTSASSSYRTKWFKADDILGLTSVDVNSYTASEASTTYRMKSKSATTSYGSIAKKDSCISLGTHKIGNTTYYPTVYNISSTKVNKVSEIKNKLALATVKENKGITLDPTSLTVAKGKTSTITATLVNTGSNSINVKSSNTNIATVSVSGKKITVKGIKNGTATITVTSGNFKATANVEVATKTILPNDIFLQQVGNSTCTLSSSAMMLRARMYLSGKSYSSITENSIKSIAWAGSGGLKWSWTYKPNNKTSISVSRKAKDGITISELKKLLNKHPEGIVLYCARNTSNQHAVLITDYVDDTFYCADPYGKYSKKRIKLEDSLLGSKFGEQSNILSKVDAYWYISSYSIK